MQTGADIMMLINESACLQYSRTGRPPTQAFLTRESHKILSDYIQNRMPVDIHEAGGDYDRPSSPWYGSRPSENGFTSIKVYTDTGYVSVHVLTDDEAVTA